MASSNRHWPSLFKSKPCGATNPSWQADLIASSSPRPPCTSAIPSGEERAPEPKPRWNPKPEQIRILEAIFNSGMVNPPREEIRRIRMQLQEYGQVGDANIFYWFQNRKSRSKHKQRLQQPCKNPRSHHPPPPSSSSSSSSSDPSTPAKKASPTASVNQVAAHGLHQALAGEPTFLQGPQDLCSLMGSPDLGFGLICGGAAMDYELDAKEKHMLQYPLPAAAATAMGGAPLLAPTSTSHGDGSPRSMLVFINEVAFEVGMGPVNVREAFGQDSMLFTSWGLPVPVDDWGVTLQPLQHGASYYLVV